MEKHKYNVDLKWEKDRIGIMSSPELESNIEVATPPEFTKGVEGMWSPEHLFTSAVLSCFMTTFLAIAEYSKLEFDNFVCKSEGILEKVEGKYLMTEIILKATLKIKFEAQKAKAERTLHKSEKACLISNSITAKVTIITDIII